MKKLYRIITPVFFFFVLSTLGCATIPPEAPELSTQLGNQISKLEKSNITLLNRFFDHKRAQVDKFIEEEWVPTFAEKIFSHPKMSKAWDTVVRENNKAQRLEFIVRTGPKLQARINQKRLELIKPLDELERHIQKNIRQEYNQARSINNSITSFLLSASKVTENRGRYLEMISISDKKIADTINKTDEVVSELLSKAEDAPGKVKKAEEYLGKIKELKEKL